MSATQIDPDRLAEFRELKLRAWKRKSCDDGLCAVEAYHWLLGEPPTYKYKSLVIGSFLSAWNDALPTSDDRDILKPLILALVDVRESIDVSYGAEQVRGLLVADWYCRHYTPTWLDLGGLPDHAKNLRDFPPLKSWDDVENIRPLLQAAGSEAQNATRIAERRAMSFDIAIAAECAAWDAAESAAWSAARYAAGNAARGAAREEVWIATWRAAWDASRYATWSVAWNAAERAPESYAKSAARGALAPTVASLQASAADLFLRMIQVRGVE